VDWNGFAAAALELRLFATNFATTPSFAESYSLTKVCLSVCVGA
jgi:hypothetical protein